jgi:hypothetical protein
MLSQQFGGQRLLRCDIERIFLAERRKERVPDIFAF